MRTKSLGLLAAGCLLAASLRSLPAGEPEYHASLDEALEAAGRSHKSVMVILVAPGKDPQGREVCKLFRDETLSDEQIAALVQRHFEPVLIDLGEFQAQKKPIPLAIRAAFKQGEQISVPLVLVFDAKCKELDRIVGYAPPGQYLPQLKKTVEKAVGPIPEKTRRDAERSLERGKEAFSQKDFNAAMDALEAALTGGVPPEQLDTARQLAAEIQAKATEALQQARDFEAEQKLGSAIRAYRDCARRFKGTKAAKEAAARLVEMRKDPDLRKRLNAYLGAELLARAKQAIEQGRYGEAADALDAIAQRYPDVEQAAEANGLRKKLDADPDMARKIREDRVRAEAERLLAVADGLRRNRMPKKAAEEYRKVIERYPDTSFAKTAEQRITELAKELKE